MGFLSSLLGKKSAPKTTEGKANNDSKNGSRFRGVQVNPNNNDCCEAVKSMVGQRYLSHEVPMLPLNECDSSDCRCTYELFEDRRTDVRRAGDVTFDIASQLRVVNRRGKDASGRRRGD